MGLLKNGVKRKVGSILKFLKVLLKLQTLNLNYVKFRELKSRITQIEVY